jgi:thiol-disulfide isomerase/thioredoxin
MTAMAALPVEGMLPDLGGATAWLHTAPLTPAGLRGKVVAVQFCTFSCVNWLRTVPYVRAWAEKYRDDGLVVLGVHSPEFPFEHDLEKIGSALGQMGVEYPVAVDNGFSVWRALDNAYWPALYLADAGGRIRYHHFGEEDYERSERVIQRLLAEAGRADVDDDLVSVEPDGVYLGADWDTLGSPETYVGYARATGFAPSGGLVPDRSQVYRAPTQLRLNNWALSGDWTVDEQIATMNEPGGRIVHRFQGRDVNLVLGSRSRGRTRFMVTVGGKPPHGSRGLDVDEQGAGTVAEERLYQLIRQESPITERTFEITFANVGAQAYVFTFG